MTQGQRREYQGSEKYVIVGSEEEEEGYQIRVFKCYLVEQWHVVEVGGSN